MISIESLYKHFVVGNQVVKAIDGINLAIDDNAFVSITGKSGSGKSTLMHLLAGLEGANSGKIIIDGTETTTLSPHALTAFRRDVMGFIFQAFHLDLNYTVFENLQVPLLIQNVPLKQHKAKIQQALDEVGLLEKLRVKTAFLSGGEKQRVAIARAIINSPKYVFADEPCGNLDSENSEIVMGLLKKLHLSGKTIILVTHNLADADLAQRVLTLKDGRIIHDINH